MSDTATQVQTVVNTLKTAWELVQNNHAVVNATADRASAVPANTDWVEHMAGGGNVNSLRFRFFIVDPVFNYFEHVNATMRLNWTYGATYRGGGAFIPNMWIDLESCDVSWGWTLNMHVQVGNPENAGTPAAPNAFLPLTIRAEAAALNNLQQSWSFGLYGSGAYTTW